MIVNKEFYDGATITYNESGAERVTVLADNLWTKIQANPDKYTGLEWDKSICPWKIGNGADIFNAMWCLPYANLENQFTFASSPFYKERKKGYTFYLSCNGNTQSGQRPGNKSNGVATCPAWLGTLSRGDIDLTDTVTANWLSLKAGDINPVINFDYSNIFVVPVIYNSAHRGANIYGYTETNWNATDVYGLGFQFYQKQSDGSSYRAVAMDIISLNNGIEKPTWTTTNAWNEKVMFDNTLALQKYTSSDAGIEIGCYEAIGSHLQTGNTRIDGVNYPGNGFNFDSPKLATDDAAGSVYYIANKQMSIAMSADGDIWENEFTSFYIGAQYNFGIHRHLKSTVTFAQFIDYVKKQLAYLGFRFCVYNEDINKNINSEFYYIPEINDKGVTTGNYYQANSAEAQILPNNTWTNDVYEKTPYDGTDDEEEADPNEYDENNETELHTNAYTAPGARFQNYYVVEPSKIVPLVQYLYNELPTSQPLDDYLTNNPIDCVVSFMEFPFTVNTGTDENVLVFFGKNNSQIPVKGYIGSLVQKIDCGECTYYSPFGANDFRSYEPYYTAEIYLPYCGNIQLNPSVFLNVNNTTKIKVEYLVDLITGACIAMVYRDNLVVEIATGQIGINLPITGIKSNDLQRDIVNRQSALKMSRNTALASVAKTIVGGGSAIASHSPAGIAGAFSSVMSTLNAMESQKIAEFNIEHVNVPYNVKGGASALTDYAYEQYPRIIFKRPVMLSNYDPVKYGHSVGFATIETDTIGNYAGYAEITGVDLSGFSATEEEKTLIRTALESGVYL